MDLPRTLHLAVEAAIRDGVKLGNQNHYLDGIPALFQAVDVLKEPQLGGEKERVKMGMQSCEIYEILANRVFAGLLIREKCVHNATTGSHWASSLLFALVQDLVPYWLDGELDG